jgi:hypothetical protein
MMGLAKIAPDGWAYYAREIAAGVEDYFRRSRTRIPAAGSAAALSPWACPARSMGRVCPGFSGRASTRLQVSLWAVLPVPTTRRRWRAMPCRSRHRNQCQSCGLWPRP